jgi:hypothetical protein
MNYETREPTSEWERAVLNYNQFQDDFGDQSDVTFKDRLVRARKIYNCTYCSGQIFPRAIYRYEIHRFDGQVRTYRSCYDCCVAMAKSWDDGGKAIEKRVYRA